MPVIQLPRDDRWGSLGQGLGALLGTAVERYQQQQAAVGVGQIQQDPMIPQDQKFAEVLKRYGDRGVNVYTQLLKSQVLQEQIRKDQAQIPLIQAETGEHATRAAVLSQTLPYAGPLAQKKVEAEGALVGARQGAEAASFAQVPLRQAETEKARAEIPVAQETVGLRQAQTRAAEATANLKQQELDRQKVGQQGFDVDAAFKSMVPGATPDQLSTAQLAYQGGKTHQEGVSKMAAYATKVQQANKPVKLEVDERRHVTDLSGAAENAETALNAFKRSPSGIGLTSGAPATQWLEGHGIATGNPQQVEIWNAAARTVFDAARSGSVFVSGTLIKAARDITPGLTETPLHFSQVINQAARENIARLRTEREIMATQRQNTDAHDKILQRWEGIERDSRVDYWATNEINGRPTGRSAVLFEGNAVDPRTFKVRLYGDKNYRSTKDGQLHKGSEIIESAKERGLDPVEAARLGGVKDVVGER